MAEFVREFRYLVLKIKDIEQYLTRQEKEVLLNLSKKISAGRCNSGKTQLDCVVVESDWPEFEATWTAIENRIKQDINKKTTT